MYFLDFNIPKRKCMVMMIYDDLCSFHDFLTVIFNIFDWFVVYEDCTFLIDSC